MAIERLYFIAIVPPEEISGQITAIKHEFTSNYGSSHALNAPPHITLHMPFKCKDSKLDDLVAMLQARAQELKSFPVWLEGFAAFPPRVIYVDVKENEALRNCQRAIMHSMRTLNVLNADYKNRPFHPHITVAFRDLRKAAFHKAWKEFESRPYSADFDVNTISLLMHVHEAGGKPHWEILKQFELATS